jgi:predicted regulator of Ras-like GTPase activity (Roadblock/LC7/MglB family)
MPARDPACRRPSFDERRRIDLFTGLERSPLKDWNEEMANIRQSLDDLLTVDGAMCAAVVDSASGMMLGSAGSGVDMEVAAAGNTEVVRAKLKTMRQLGLNDVIDDILITLGKHYHIIRPVSRKEGVFVYFVLDKAKSNLALARRKAQDVERELTI